MAKSSRKDASGVAKLDTVADRHMQALTALAAIQHRLRLENFTAISGVPTTRGTPVKAQAFTVTLVVILTIWLAAVAYTFVKGSAPTILGYTI